MGSEKFCLRWNDFESNISSAFRELREDKDFFDVTLACDDEQIQAHKVILSACSPFFRSVLRRNPHAHPLLYLKGVRYSDLTSVLNFMYHGEVNVAQEELNSFLAVAEDLKVKGLTQGNSETAPPPRTELPKPRPREITEPAPPKRPRPGPSPQITTRPAPTPQQSYHQPDDDEIQEVAPIVKSEPAAAAPEPSYAAAGQGVVADPNMYEGDEYGEEYGYEGEYDGSMIDPNMAGNDGNKDLQSLVHSLLERTVDVLNLPVWQCSACGKTSNKSTNLRDHIEANHNPGFFTNCATCFKTFKTSASLRMHTIKFHKV